WAYFRYAQARDANYQAPEKLPEPTTQANPADANLEVGTLNSTGTSTSGGGVLKWYVIALVIFALGMMSKPMLVTVPCLLLLLDLWPLNRFIKDAPRRRFAVLLLEKVPFFLVTVIFSVVTFIAQKKDDLVMDLGTFPLKARLANSVVSYARYVGKTL